MSTDNLKVMLEATEQHAERGWNEAHEQEARAETAEARIAALEAERDALTAQCEASKKAVDLWNRWADPEDKFPESLSTDAFLREQMARGIELWVESRNGAWNGTTEQALKFADQLRAGEAV